MSDYMTTRTAAARVTERFADMLRNLEDDLVVVALMESYAITEDQDLKVAIERVLEHFMAPHDFNAWMLTVYNKSKEQCGD